MAQRIYTTDGLVLRKEGAGETSLSALVLTEDYGLVRMRAQGARMSKGKLRFALEPMTLGSYSFVSGRFGARLVGAQAHEFLLPLHLSAARRVCGNLTKLALRLLPGEEHHAELFSGLVRGLRFLARAEPEVLPAAECAVVLHMLKVLGYLPEDPALARFATADITEQLVEEIAASKTQTVRMINAILMETGL
jgi:DNA repair protein RecO